MFVFDPKIICGEREEELAISSAPFHCMGKKFALPLFSFLYFARVHIFFRG